MGQPMTTKNLSSYRVLSIALAALFCAAAAKAEPISVLFVGNSYTFARVDPVLSYNAANVRDLTQPQGPLRTQNTGTAPFSNVTGTNSYPVDPMTGLAAIDPATGLRFESYSPHSQTQAWSGVAGIFKQMTVQAGLNYDVALSTRNAASLRGHLLNSATSNWDLRGNIGSQQWGQVVLQEQSDEPLARQPGLGSNPERFRFYADKIENFVHSKATQTFRDLDAYAGANDIERLANCVAATTITTAANASNTCSLVRSVTNANASASTELFLYQTWARPDLIYSPGAKTIDPATGNATYNNTPQPSYFKDLESMTEQLKTAYQGALENADNDGTSGFKAVAPVGEAFLRAVTSGMATRDMYAADAASDGLMDLWFNDGTDASKYGSYLSALTLFGTLTGLDPQSLGFHEIAARDLGISGHDAYSLQQIAALSLGLQKVPEPASLALVLTGLGMLSFVSRRQKKPR